MEERAPPQTRGLLIGIGVAMVVLSVLFGWRTLQQRAQYREYKEQTVSEADLPWTGAALGVDACVEWTVEWGMACSGMEAWCMGEAPRLALACLESSDRSAFCEEAGQGIKSTHFGYAQCEAMREDLDGHHLKKAHKKYCASIYRAVAEHCQRGAGS